ncbi:hypothetical protein N0V82_005976 [Gnomoniopsis sp. IMI 355080]|nr:hypothetical protein N0V82_005976 [Gnomoniopsis sp. IMI 355080]
MNGSTTTPVPNNDDDDNNNHNLPVDVAVVDALDDSRLAEVLDDSPERIHSDPLPSQPTFPDHARSESTPQFRSSLVEAKDAYQSPVPAYDSPSNRTSMSHWDPEPGFAHINGDIGGSGYNETRVDIITVPCPGADPVETWTRDPLPHDYFGNSLDNELTAHPALKELAGDAVLSPGIGHDFTKAAHLWVKQGIRRYASTARVLLYRHRELSDHTSLDSLARDLLHNVMLTRDSGQKSRPLFFVAHSIGGLVVKKALLIASQDENLRLGSKSLLEMHEAFTDIASEMRIWSFYETIDSRLSGSGHGHTTEVEFTAPLVSIKSALIGVRHELIYSSLESDHAHCASFGISNPRTLGVYLQDLAAAVKKAEGLSHAEHHPLKLKDKVKVEMIGFYDDPDAGVESDIRLYIKKSHLSEFLQKGPEQCLEERLRRVPQRPGSGHPRASTHRPSHSSGGFIDNVQRFLRSVSRSPERQPRPASPGFMFTPPSAAEGHAPGGVHERRLHSLTIPAPPQRGTNRPSSRGSDGTATTVSEPIGHRTSMDAAISSEQREQDAPSKTDAGHMGLGITSTARSQRSSVANAIHDLTAGFSRPNPKKRKFMWIHTPFTNPVWVKDIFDRLSESHHQDFSKLINNENWVSRHVHGRHSRSQPSFVKPAINYISGDSIPSPRPSHSSNLPTRSTASPTYLSLYFPYLHFETYRHIIRRRGVITRRLAHGRARPVPADIAALDSLELRMLWEYIGHDPPLNSRRTLDQFGYPSLKDTNARDDDQMLYKLTKEDKLRSPLPAVVSKGAANIEREYSFGTRLLHEMIEREKEQVAAEEESGEGETELRDGNLLMVDQLWLWAIDTTTLTTFFPKRESRPSEGAMFQQADLRNSIYNELNGDLTGRCENALDLAAFVVLHAVTVLLDRSSHPDLEVFRIFEEAIGMLTERMTSNLKKFRMQTFKDVEADSDGEPEDNTAASIKKRHKREIERAERENRENTSALLELRDMEDELKTLYRLFDTQETLASRMADIYSGEALRDITLHGQGYLHEALSRLTEYKTQTTEMLERVGATRGDYEKLLEMAQRQAQVDDVRWSRLQTELASSQNLSVMIFTIFTVIFLPLSFFTSLFGMNTFDWAGDPTSAFPTLSFIGQVSLPASVAMILITLIAAFSPRVQVAAKSAWRRVRQATSWVREGLRRLEPAASRRAKQRRRADKEREEKAERERRRKERGYDFWATVRRQRTLGSYEIPEVNRVLVRAGTGFESAVSGGKGVGLERRGRR